MPSSPLVSANQPATRLATRLAFLVAGFGVSCWAPLVPFAKNRLGVDEGVLGMLLLCIGVGSIIAMLLTGVLSVRYGSRPIIMVGGLGLAVFLPLLAIAGSPFTLGLALFAFGAFLGSLDVAMNIHAVEVERDSPRPLLSGFHALYSIGGFLGATLMTFLLSVQLGAPVSTLICCVLMIIAMLVTWPRLLRTSATISGPLLAIPRGIVLILAGLAAATFLAEGAILDWSALLLTELKVVRAEHGGLGYMLFSIAMTAGRLCGDVIVARMGDRTIMIWGGLIAMAGFVILLIVPITIIAMTGFIFIGLGASNIVPVLFRRAGSQRVMPAGLAVAAITTTGYAGILAGPAAVGFVAKLVGLPMAFWMLVALLALIPACARLVTSTHK